MSSQAQQDTSGRTHLYRHFAVDGDLLYVGISLSALHRLVQHKDHSGWFSQISRVEIATYPSRPDALKAERQAILAENPRHNVKRPKEIATARQRAALEDSGEIVRGAERAEQELVDRVVRFDIWYEATSLPLPFSRKQIQAYMDAGYLSYLEFQNRTGTKMKRYVTGWQLIDFIEWLESQQRKSGRVA